MPNHTFRVGDRVYDKATDLTTTITRITTHPETRIWGYWEENVNGERVKRGVEQQTNKLYNLEIIYSPINKHVNRLMRYQRSL